MGHGGDAYCADGPDLDGALEGAECEELEVGANGLGPLLEELQYLQEQLQESRIGVVSLAKEMCASGVAEGLKLGFE